MTDRQEELKVPKINSKKLKEVEFNNLSISEQLRLLEKEGIVKKTLKFFMEKEEQKPAEPNKQVAANKKNEVSGNLEQIRDKKDSTKPEQQPVSVRSSDSGFSELNYSFQGPTSTMEATPDIETQTEPWDEKKADLDQKKDAQKLTKTLQNTTRDPKNKSKGNVRNKKEQFENLSTSESEKTNKRPKEIEEELAAIAKAHLVTGSPLKNRSRGKIDEPHKETREIATQTPWGVGTQIDQEMMKDQDPLSSSKQIENTHQIKKFKSNTANYIRYFRWLLNLWPLAAWPLCYAWVASILPAILLAEFALPATALIFSAVCLSFYLPKLINFIRSWGKKKNKEKDKELHPDKDLEKDKELQLKDRELQLEEALAKEKEKQQRPFWKKVIRFFKKHHKAIVITFVVTAVVASLGVFFMPAALSALFIPIAANGIYLIGAGAMIGAAISIGFQLADKFIFKRAENTVRRNDRIKYLEKELAAVKKERQLVQEMKKNEKIQSSEFKKDDELAVPLEAANNRNSAVDRRLSTQSDDSYIEVELRNKSDSGMSSVSSSLTGGNDLKLSSTLSNEQNPSESTRNTIEAQVHHWNDSPVNGSNSNEVEPKSTDDKNSLQKRVEEGRAGLNHTQSRQVEEKHPNPLTL